MNTPSDIPAITPFLSIILLKYTNNSSGLSLKNLIFFTTTSLDNSGNVGLPTIYTSLANYNLSFINTVKSNIFGENIQLRIHGANPIILLRLDTIIFM